MSLNEQDKLWIAATQAAITRARRILLTTTLISGWLIAVQLIELVKWEPIRRPASENYARALIATLQAYPIKVHRVPDPGSSGRTILGATPADAPEGSTIPSLAAGVRRLTRGHGRSGRSASATAIAAARDTTAGALMGDSVFIYLPVHASMLEAVDWCVQNRRAIRSQLPTEINNGVDMLITRAKIGSDALPPSIISRPQVGIPLLGIPVAADDATIVGAIMLFIAMLWLCFASFQARDSMKVLREKCSDPEFVKAWLPHQFLFINQAERTPERVAYPLIYLPYGAVLFGFLVNVSGIVVQIMTYSRLAGFHKFRGIPLVDGPNGLPWFMQETLGILCIRYAIELAAVYWLLNFAESAWETLCELYEEGVVRAVVETRRGHDRVRFVFFTLATGGIVVAWTLAHYLFLDEMVKARGWIYGPTLAAALGLILLGFGIALVMTFLLNSPPWKRPGRRS